MRIRFRKPREVPAKLEGGPAGASQSPSGNDASGARSSPQAAAAPSTPSTVAHKPGTGTPAGTPATGPAASAPSGDATPGGTPEDAIGGIRAWLAQLDRKLGVRTYVGAAIALLAAAAAAAGLALAISVRQDAATKSDIDSLRNELSGVEQTATEAAQNRVKSLNQRLTTLQSRVDKLAASQTTTKRELRVVQDDIRELRGQTPGTGQAGAGGAGTSGLGSLGSGTGTGTGAGGGGSKAGSGSGGTGP